MKKNIQTMKEDIKLKVQEQKIAKANRKTVHIQVERTMSPTEAYFKSIKLKEELRHMYLAYGVLRGMTPEVIEQNAKTPYNKDWVKRITEKYELSQHAAASTLSRAGRNGCAKCHGHEGFVETTWTGEDTTATDIPLPQRIQCETCHDFHESLDFENEPNHAIRAMDEITLMAEETTKMVGFTDVESNLCMNCHQSRRNPSYYYADDDLTPLLPGDSIDVSGHYGPHHGPQANFINGLGGYEFGAALGTSGTHESGTNCIECHMTETAADTTGGHTWVASLDGCLTCHADDTDYDVNGAITEIEALVAELHALLVAEGVIDSEGHAVSGRYSATVGGSLWNYILIEEEDMSMGIHNPAYAKVLLNNSITALEALP